MGFFLETAQDKFYAKLYPVIFLTKNIPRNLMKKYVKTWNRKTEYPLH